MQTQGYYARVVVAGALGVALLSLFLLPLGSAAQSGGGYDLVWSAITSGSSTASGGAYQLGGTIGQADAGVSSGGGYTVVGGFWAGGPNGYTVYLPLTVKLL